MLGHESLIPRRTDVGGWITHHCRRRRDYREGQKLNRQSARRVKDIGLTAVGREAAAVAADSCGDDRCSRDGRDGPLSDAPLLPHLAAYVVPQSKVPEYIGSRRPVDEIFDLKRLFLPDADALSAVWNDTIVSADIVAAAGALLLASD